VFSGGGGALHRPRTRQRPKAGGRETYTKVRMSGYENSSWWAERAGTSKVTPVTSALMSSHLSHIRTEREGWHRNSTLCSYVTLPPSKRCFKRPSASCLNKIATRSQRGTSTPFSPPSGASFFVGPSSEAERDVSSATYFPAYVPCQLSACAAPSCEFLRRSILGGLYPIPTPTHTTPPADSLSNFPSHPTT
jgi:hypothetical protein